MCFTICLLKCTELIKREFWNIFYAAYFPTQFPRTNNILVSDDVAGG